MKWCLCEIKKNIHLTEVLVDSLRLMYQFELISTIRIQMLSILMIVLIPVQRYGMENYNNYEIKFLCRKFHQESSVMAEQSNKNFQFVSQT